MRSAAKYSPRGGKLTGTGSKPVCGRLGGISAGLAVRGTKLRLLLFSCPYCCLARPARLALRAAFRRLPRAAIRAGGRVVRGLTLASLLRRRQVTVDFIAQGAELGFKFGQALCLGRAAVLAFAQFFDQSLEGGSITPGRLGIARIHRALSTRCGTPRQPHRVEWRSSRLLTAQGSQFSDR